MFLSILIKKLVIFNCKLMLRTRMNNYMIFIILYLENYSDAAQKGKTTFINCVFAYKLCCVCRFKNAPGNFINSFALSACQFVFSKSQTRVNCWWIVFCKCNQLTLLLLIIKGSMLLATPTKWLVDPARKMVAFFEYTILVK